MMIFTFDEFEGIRQAVINRIKKDVELGWWAAVELGLIVYGKLITGSEVRDGLSKPQGGNNG